LLPYLLFFINTISIKKQTIKNIIFYKNNFTIQKKIWKFFYNFSFLKSKNFLGIFLFIEITRVAPPPLKQGGVWGGIRGGYVGGGCSFSPPFFCY